MATADRDDNRDDNRDNNRDDSRDEILGIPRDENATEEVEAGASGAMAAGVPGTTMGQGLAGTLGGAVLGQILARDIMDNQSLEGSGTSEPDTDDSPDSFAGGGATSAGRDSG
jgi:hypothetical protein